VQYFFILSETAFQAAADIVRVRRPAVIQLSRIAAGSVRPVRAMRLVQLARRSIGADDSVTLVEPAVLSDGWSASEPG